MIEIHSETDPALSVRYHGGTTFNVYRNGREIDAFTAHDPHTGNPLGLAQAIATAEAHLATLDGSALQALASEAHATLSDLLSDLSGLHDESVAADELRTSLERAILYAQELGA